MNKTLASITSLVFHPFLIPVYSLLILYIAFPFRYEYVPIKTWNLTIGTIIGMTILFPLLIVFICHKLNIVDDMDLTVQKQRILPYMIFFFFYLMSFLMLKPKATGSIVFMEDTLMATMLLGATLSIVISFFLNNFLKVSIHTLGVSNLFMQICIFSRYTQINLFFMIVLALIVVGLVGSSRIFLHSHSPKQIYYGFFAGILGQILAFLFYLQSIPS